MERVECFKSYDIRMTGEEQGPENLDRVCNAAIAYLQTKNAPGIVLGADMRITSQIIKNSLLGRALSSGMNVISVQDTKNNACSTPLFNYTCSLNPENVGVMITASHNPKEYNGLKVNDTRCRSIGYNEGLYVCEDLYKRRTKPTVKSATGNLTNTYPLEEMIIETVELLGMKQDSLKNVKIAFDCANSMGTIDAKPFFNYLGAEVKYVNDWLDGTFPAHESNPMIEKNLKTLQSLVKTDNFLCGATGDGDYDRIGIIDEEGNPLFAHNMATLAVREIINLAKVAEVHAIYATTMGRSFRDALQSFGGQAHRVPVGRINIINKGLELMKQNKTVLIGAEGSNHIMFPDKRGNFYENILMATGAIISYCKRQDKQLSNVVEQTNNYAFLGEQNFEISKKNTAKLRQYIENNHKNILDGKLSKDDGILVEDENSWFSLRESNTEPLARLNVESDSIEKTNKIAKDITEVINSFGGSRK
ncbi:hypothetical protein GOV14_05970 [Candidatus Pacearchaeota archaeon]|nr:hypothetical protein [Candidatus Pacearchaeota archaeon]